MSDADGIPDAALIAQSLELLSQRVGDLAPFVYARLFDRHPETEALFLMDHGGHVRGQMLTVAIEALLDLYGDRAYAPGLLSIERINHANLGVPAELFDSFYGILAETVRELLGADWTPAMGAAWGRLLDGLRAAEDAS